MAPVNAYGGVVARGGHSWLADGPAVPGAHTYARSLAGLAKSVREVIVLMADLDDDDTPELTFTYKVSDEVVQEAAAVGRERRAASEREQSRWAHPQTAGAARRRRGGAVAEKKVTNGGVKKAAE